MRNPKGLPTAADMAVAEAMSNAQIVGGIARARVAFRRAAPDWAAYRAQVARYAVAEARGLYIDPVE